MGFTLTRAESEGGQDTLHLKCDGPGCRAQKTIVPGRGSWGSWALVTMPAIGETAGVCSGACADSWLEWANGERIRAGLRAMEEVGA